MEKILKHKKLVVLTILVALAGFFTLYLSIGNMKATELENWDNIAYEKDQFSHVNDLETLEKNKLVSEKGNLKLYFDESTTQFYVEDTVTNEKWYSNPQGEDPLASLASIKNRQKATLVIYYSDSSGAEVSRSNYEFSIQHEIDDPAKQHSYSIRYLDDAVQVLYQIEKRVIDKTYFPQFLTIERREEIFANENLSSRDKMYLETVYELDEKNNRYKFKNYENPSNTQIKNLYEMFYNEEKLNYNFEQLEKDNEPFDINIEMDDPYFEVAVEYRLTEDGFRASVISDSIVEEKDYPITGINFLPYFGAVSTDYEGYYVIPDGSGVLMNFNNGKEYQRVYTKRYYGEDIALQSNVKPESEETLLLPMYGVVNSTTNNGMLVTIENNASMVTLNADVSRRNDSYNKIYPRFNYREVETVLYANVGEKYYVPTWTNHRVERDFVMQYQFVNGDKANYTGLASAYRNYLGLESNDLTTNTVMNLTVLGMFDKKEFFLGVPYTSTKSLTTFDEAKIILQELNLEGIDNINLMYNGWFNGGIDHDIATDIKIGRAVGGKRDFRNFVDYLEENNVTFYPSMNLMTARDYTKMFDQYRYTAQHINGKSAVLSQYDLATKLVDEEAHTSYILSPNYYQDMIARMLKEYNDFEIGNLSVNDLGGQVSGHYKKNNYTFRYEAEEMQKLALESLREDNKLSLTSPLGFALGYVDNIVDAPIEGSKYPILDSSIPFYQLVLNGVVDYAGISVNLNSEKGLDFHLMKAIETGGNLNFIFSYKDSSILLNTDYNEYYSTNYRNWMDNAVEMVKELDELGIHSSTIKNHQILANNVYMVEYENGSTFVINYSLTPYTHEGQIVESESYILLGGDLNEA